MILLEKFCFCIDMRKGCIIIGLLGVAGRAWAGIGNGIGWIYLVPMDSLHRWRAIICISNGFVGIAAGVVLFCGAMKKSKTLVKTYIPIIALLILLILTSAILGIYTVCSSEWRGYSNTDSCRKDEGCIIWTIYVLTLDIIDLLAYIYFGICAYYYLHILKQNRTLPKDEQLQNQEQLVVY